jgi:hypothetical protein
MKSSAGLDENCYVPNFQTQGHNNSALLQYKFKNRPGESTNLQGPRFPASVMLVCGRIRLVRPSAVIINHKKWVYRVTLENCSHKNRRRNVGWLHLLAITTSRVSREGKLSNPRGRAAGARWIIMSLGNLRTLAPVRRAGAMLFNTAVRFQNRFY